MLFLIPVAAFFVLGGASYVAGMPKPAPVLAAETVPIPSAGGVVVSDVSADSAPAADAPGAVTAAGDTAVTASVDVGWAARTGAATGIPIRALQAYAMAAHLTERSTPGCHLGWNTIAGIGSIESDHGRHGGATLGDDGRPQPPIIGLPLNGVGVAAIPDTDDGEWDGDTQWDRAVGPLQFIPDTWRSHGGDGDGDGVADPQDLDDAALATARYLCDAGGDLSTASGWTDAVFAYNHLDSYVAAVREKAILYADLTAIAGG